MTEQIDTKAILAQTDLFSLVAGLDGRGDLQRGACPKCGGKDRFTVKVLDGRQLCNCNQCQPGQWKDAIGYVQWMQGLSFLDACAALTTGELPTMIGVARGGSKPVEVRYNPDAPGAEWQRSAAACLSEWQAVLWSDSAAGRGGLHYLHKRGLNDATIKAAGLGLVVKSGDYNGLWAARGIAIPWMCGGLLWAINVRRSQKDIDKDGGPKYKMIKGSLRGGTLYGVDALRGRAALAVVEGEFDALLLAQEAGEFCDTVTLGANNARLSERWATRLDDYRRFLIMTDSDNAGDFARSYWAAICGELAQHVHVKDGKDVTDMWAARHSLGAWVEGLTADLRPAPTLQPEPTPELEPEHPQAQPVTRWVKDLVELVDLPEYTKVHPGAIIDNVVWYGASNPYPKAKK